MINTEKPSRAAGEPVKLSLGTKRGTPELQKHSVRTGLSVVLLGTALVATLALFSIHLFRHGSTATHPKTAATSRGAITSTKTHHYVPNGMHLIFHVNFVSKDLNHSIWSTCFPWADQDQGCTNFGNPEFQWFLPSQVRIRQDSLELLASQKSTSGYDQEGKPITYAWRSGMVTTYRSLAFTYGYVEVTARLATGPGFWSALWLLPENQSWPPEIDLVELLGGNPERPSYFYHPQTGPYLGYAPPKPSPNLSRGWHTFAVDWEPGSIIWYTDNHEVYEYRGPTPDVPMYFLADLAVTLGTTRSSPRKVAMYIKSVSVYQR